MLRVVALALLALLWSAAAQAADQPQYAPAPSWVRPAPIPAASSVASPGAVQVLLEDSQVRFGPEGDEFYVETAVKILAAPALVAASNFVLNWRPDTETLIIHKLEIIRGDQTIDLLAGGKAVTVLRREKNLEMAMLDGTLTATVQPSDIRVGDIVHAAYTLQRNDPVMQGRSEGMELLSRPGVIGRAYFRASWSSPKDIRWRSTDGFGDPAVRPSGDDRELVFDLKDVQLPDPPAYAPARYNDLGELELSQFKDWSEVSSLMSPLYEKAATLRAGSPLEAEAEKIKSASSSQKAQALAALELVEDQVRYLFLGMNEGGYTPADADITWTRRFGDCKGKTVLLLALLKQLGVEAEPALVSTDGGDGLDERLPGLYFDHVLVRAQIGGKTYWLDGTRLGDRDLDDIPIPNFHWALPVQPAGAKLQALSPPPYTEPQFEGVLNIDASGGLDAPAPTHAEHLYRGDAAIAMHLDLDSRDRTDTERNLKDQWRRDIPWVEPKAVKSSYDSVTGVERVTMDGDATIPWQSYGRVRDFQIADSVEGYNISYARDSGPHQDAPYAVDYPLYKKWTVTMRLPQGGAGFRLVGGPDLAETVGEIEYHRTSSIQDGVVTMVDSEHSVAPEFPASAADAVATTLRSMGSTAVTVRVGAAAEVVSSDADQPSSKQSLDAGALDHEGAAALRRGDYAAAIDDFTGAAHLEPDVAKHLYDRGVAHFEKGDTGLAINDFTAALKLNPNDVLALAGRAEAYLVKGRHDAAESDFDEAAHLAPTDQSLRQRREAAYEHFASLDAQITDLSDLIQEVSDPAQRAVLLGRRCEKRAMSRQQLDGALDDCERALKLVPNDADFITTRALVHLELGQFADAITDYDVDLDVRPADADGLYGRGLARLRLGITAQGQADIAAAKQSDSGIEQRFDRYGLRPGG